jgi:steroid delta-isomerase-like uncharacterized protein
MTNDDPKDVVRRYFVEFNYGRLKPDDPRYSSLESICTPDYTMHFNRAGEYGERVGLGQFKEALASMFSTWSRLSFELHDLISEGDRVVARFVIHGTISDGFRGYPAKNKDVSFAGNNILDVRDGKIAGEWIYEDFLSVFQQIGAIS